MSAAAHRVDELRARREAHAADRAAFEERRRYGLRARHAAKLAHLTAREQAMSQAREEPTEEPENSTAPTRGMAPEVA
jgi:hypothetical protein